MAAQDGPNGVMSEQPNIVLVHGAWADGSPWAGLIERLQADGYKVIAPQFPLSGRAGDVARLRQGLAAQGIPPAAERQFAERMGATTVEVPSGHVAMVSRPDEVTRLILDASAAVRREEVLT